MSAFCTVEQDGPGAGFIELIVGPSGQRGNQWAFASSGLVFITGARLWWVVELHHDGTGGELLINEAGEPFCIR